MDNPGDCKLSKSKRRHLRERRTAVRHAIINTEGLNKVFPFVAAEAKSSIQSEVAGLTTHSLMVKLLTRFDAIEQMMANVVNFAHGGWAPWSEAQSTVSPADVVVDYLPQQSESSKLCRDAPEFVPISQTAKYTQSVENRCQYLQSFWEPIDPWLFLDRGELGQVRATCMKHSAMVDQFTPFGAFAADARDGNNKSLEQDEDAACLEPEVLDASCESAGTSGPSTSTPSTSSQRLVDIGPIKMHALSMAKADGLFDAIFTESDATRIYDKYFVQGVALNLNDVQGIESYMQNFFDDLNVERQRIYRERLT